ncbi:hypothetical protein BAL199_20460 [alpha proteobacterium BAL199]|nr:hypothetical protein BAL199_20460 [alpha proteobacterium BAL199]
MVAVGRCTAKPRSGATVVDLQEARMCGRYSVTTDPEALRRIFGVDTLMNLMPRWNVAPTQEVPVIKADDRIGRMLTIMRWGLVPFWAKDIGIGAKLINARAETVNEKPAFRGAFRYRRCLVPADGFYEWKTEAKVKQPWRIARRDRAPFAMAGLWELWEGTGEGSALETFSIVTTEANSAIRDIHHRMPVMLFGEEQFQTWLKGSLKEAAGLMEPCDPVVIEAFRVDPKVGNVRNDDPSLIEPITRAPAMPAQSSLF